MIKEFDPSNKKHVQWFKKVVDAPTEKKMSMLEDNPMNQSVPAFDMVQILFGISMKYTQAVFKKTAHLLDD
jgi:hypothetical protein